MARPKGSRSLASRLMGGRVKEAGIYEEVTEGQQVYVHAMWRFVGTGAGRLVIHYVGCGGAGRAHEVVKRSENPQLTAWLAEYWVGRTLLFAKPNRLESIAWLESVLLEYGCREGLVIFETPFLLHAKRVESRLIERYMEQNQPLFNQKLSKLATKQLRPQPLLGCLRPHVTTIRQRLAAGESVAALGREYGVTPHSIRSIKNGKSYKSVA